MQARLLSLPLGLIAASWLALPAAAAPYSFSTGNPDGKIATLSRPASAGQTETETADDFILGQATQMALIGFRGGETRIKKLGCEHLVREQRRE